MGKERLTAQDRGAGADTGMIIAKDLLGRIKKDTFFFAGELFIDADPFHCSTSADRDLSVLPESITLIAKKIKRC